MLHTKGVSSGLHKINGLSTDYSAHNTVETQPSEIYSALGEHKKVVDDTVLWCGLDVKQSYCLLSNGGGNSFYSNKGRQIQNISIPQ